MRHVQRNEILDWQSYGDVRDRFRAQVMEEKVPRRVHVGEFLTFLFENPLTIRYQIQEMVRAERIVRESDIEHEITTYNEILGGEGEVGCTLLVEIEDPALRDRRLREWLELPEHIYLLHEDGSRTYATSDPRQRGEDSLSSVQYLKFAVGNRVPVGAGIDLPGRKGAQGLQAEVRFTAETRHALADDLEGREASIGS
jgi:Protein of unknown function (DUF3501)